MALRGTKADHKIAADSYMKQAKQLHKTALDAVKKGMCTAAYINIVGMWQAIGRSEGNWREGGEPVWRPTSDIADLGYEFSTKCLRNTPSTLSGAKKKKRR